MAKFGFVMIMTWLGTFAAIGCTGLAMILAGFGLDMAATEKILPARENPIDKPLSPA